ncbi:MAG: hypothetical protein RLZZ595_2007, partial [Bacteroidota bacterium]
MALLEISLPKSLAHALRLPKNSPGRQQRKILTKLLKKAKYTEFGQFYNFDQILSSKSPEESFRKAVPTHDYNSIYSQWWKKTLEGNSDVCWPGKIKYFA